MTNSAKQEPLPATRQLAMTLDSAKLQGMTPAKRHAVIALLAGLLLEAAGAAAGESGNDRI